MVECNNLRQGDLGHCLLQTQTRVCLVLHSGRSIKINNHISSTDLHPWWDAHDCPHHSFSQAGYLLWNWVYSIASEQLWATARGTSSVKDTLHTCKRTLLSKNWCDILDKSLRTAISNFWRGGGVFGSTGFHLHKMTSTKHFSYGKQYHTN